MVLREDALDRLEGALAQLGAGWDRHAFAVGFLMGLGIPYQSACEIAREVTT